MGNVSEEILTPNIGEILFFKVFRNKVTRTIIFNFIKGTGLGYSKIQSAFLMACNKSWYGLFIDKLKKQQYIVFEPDCHPKVVAMIQDLEIFELYISNRRVNPIGKPILWVDYAAACGRLDFIKHLELTKQFNHENAIDNACLSGSLEVVQYLEEKISNCSRMALDNASKKGNLEIVKYLVENRTEGGTNALSLAIENAHLEVVKYLTQQDSILNLTTTSDSWDTVAKKGNIDIIKYLFENRTEGFTSFAVNNAAMSGNLEVLKYLIEVAKCEGTHHALSLSAKNNHTDVCKYLIDKKQPGNDNCACNAANVGNTHLVEYIYENSSFRVTKNTFANVCLKGDLEMVKCLTQLQVPCSSEAWEKAAQNGHIKVIEFLHLNRPSDKPSPQAANLAALYGHYEVLCFLIKYHPNESNLKSALTMATSQRNIKIVKLLQQSIADPTVLNSIFVS